MNALCKNPECGQSYTPNKKGAVRDYCARCVMWRRRHGGELPGPKIERGEKGLKHTVVLPKDFADRLAKLSDLPLSTWVRLAAEETLEGMERKR